MREVAQVSKMIAVCGAPGSGKTTAALKIAEEIYYAKKGSVIFLSPDLNVPCLAYIFPNCKEAELYSVGVALDRTDILKHVWGEAYFGEEKIVDVNIRRLRMKIEEEPSTPRHIVTVWGLGYKWEA